MQPAAPRRGRNTAHIDPRGRPAVFHSLKQPEHLKIRRGGRDGFFQGRGFYSEPAGKPSQTIKRLAVEKTGIKPVRPPGPQPFKDLGPAAYYYKTVAAPFEQIRNRIIAAFAMIIRR